MLIVNNHPKKIATIAPAGLIVLLIILAYSNVVFLRRSLNPVLLIPPAEIKLSTGYEDIAGPPINMHGWQVDLANPAYLEWPVNVFVGSCLKSGYIPLVMSYQSLGLPLIGQYCHRILSPYQMIENLFFPRGYDFFLLLRLILAGIFTYLFLRPLCRSLASPLLSAIGYALGSVMVIFSNHEEVSNVAMFLPLLMWAIRAFFDRPVLARGCGLTLALALTHTAGQPEIQLYVLLLAFVYGLMRFFRTARSGRPAALIYGLIAILLSAVIAAPQIILFLRFHQEAWTYHPPGGTLGLQSPTELDSFLFAFIPKILHCPWPWPFRTVNLKWDLVGGYFSFGLLLLAAAAFRRPGRNRSESVLFGLYLFFILAKNLGWSPGQMLGVLPFFDQTWSPRWAAASWSFALAVLAGFGLENLLEQSPEKVSPAPSGARKPGKIKQLFSPPQFRWLVFLGAAVLAVVLAHQGRLTWRRANLRRYVLYHGAFFWMAALAVFAGFHLLPRAVKNYLSRVAGELKNAFADNQIGMIPLLAAAACLAGSLFPPMHYIFHPQFPEPFLCYFIAAPVFLLSLFGIFFIATRPTHWAVAVMATITVPLVILASWDRTPHRSLINLSLLFLSLAALSIIIFAGKKGILQILLPCLSGLFLLYLAIATFTTKYSPSEIVNRTLKFHCVLAMILLSPYPILSWWRSRGHGIHGEFILLLIWAELTIYIPRNHFDKYLLIDAVVFAVALLLVAGLIIWQKGRSLSPQARAAFLSLGLLLCTSVLLSADIRMSSKLPPACSPSKPLPFVRFLQGKGPVAVSGVGRVLSPNFASAHGIVDMRGCVSMNTRSYQFFLERILQVVPPNLSFSLWFTGDNPIYQAINNVYDSFLPAHQAAFNRAWPFYALSSAKYILCPRGALDQIGSSLGQNMRKEYANEVDIWELSALPPAFLVHKFSVLSLLADPNRWRKTVLENSEILSGKRILLEKEPPIAYPETESSSLEQVKMILVDNPNLIRIKVLSPESGYLVINRLYTNLIRAYVNKKEVPVLQANGPFIAVPVSGSQEWQTVELSYLSPATKLLFALSLAGIGLVAAGLLVSRRTRP